MQRTTTHTRINRVSALAAAFLLVLALAVPSAGRAESKLQIMTATTDLASLAQEVGGDKVDVESIARGYQDPHFVEAKPSFLLKLRRADLLISRSGATTVAEITACGKRAIFIPFPHAIYGHQERNAHVLEHAGAAAVILEAELTGDTLAQTILSLIADRPRLAEMARRSRSLGRSDSAEQIVTMCRQLVAGAAA